VDPYHATVQPEATPLVSVVIPTYNQASYLGEAIESVLTQTYQRIELIVVDDGSTDGTPEVIAGYAGRMTAIRQENHGAAHALNVGLQAARGDFICWLSSDDAYLPDKIERQVATLVGDPAAGLCCTGWETIDGEGRLLKRYPSLEWVHPDPVVAIFWRNPINGTTVMIPRLVFDELGGFDETLPADVDGDMWLRIAEHRPIVTIPEILARYRIHAGAQSRDKTLMQTWKTEVRLARMRDGSVVRRVRASDRAAAAAVLARIGQDHVRQGLPRLGRALLGASLRAGVAPTEQVRLARALVLPAIPAPIREAPKRATRLVGSTLRTIARVPGARRLVRAVRGSR
jgi:glycosyltransferase involved in cell wall biosynthesis